MSKIFFDKQKRLVGIITDCIMKDKILIKNININIVKIQDKFDKR